MREPAERLGDLRAQVAANELGARRLLELVDRRGATKVRTFAEEVMDYSERRVRAAIQPLPRGTWSAEDVLEGSGEDEGRDLRIRAEVTLGGSGMSVNFEGTDRQVRGNLNAPFAVTLSAAYYVLRCVTDPGAPPNAGA
jgi:N-methylhydantoinase B